MPSVRLTVLMIEIYFLPNKTQTHYGFANLPGVFLSRIRKVARIRTLHAISSFRRFVNEIFILLGCFAALIGNKLLKVENGFNSLS